MASNIGNLWLFSSKAELDATGSASGLKVGAVALVAGSVPYTVSSVTASTSTSTMASAPSLAPSFCYDTLNNTATKYASWLTGMFATSYGGETEMLAPYDGALLRIILETANAAGSTDLMFYRAGSAVATVNQTMSASSATIYDFTAEDNTYTAGQLIGLGLTPAATPGLTRMTAVWQYSPS